jgi:hypothetical protein
MIMTNINHMQYNEQKTSFDYQEFMCRFMQPIALWIREQ